MVKRLNLINNSEFDEIKLLFRETLKRNIEIEDNVLSIIENVKQNGDRAILEYNRKFDNADFPIGELRVSSSEIEMAKESVPKRFMKAIASASDRISKYHKLQLPEDNFFYDSIGMGLGHRWTSIAGVGIYVPGGTAVYPSSVLMNSIPAKVAKVDRIVMVVPAPNGIIDPIILATADIVGVKEIYKVGGAQAIAALAYGTETISPVEKIVGPGNIYVATAKKQVFGHVGIDSFAGPSEILVVADSSANPKWIAADLLSQAEHDVDAVPILICDDDGFSNEVEKYISLHLKGLNRADIALKSWEKNGLIITLDNVINSGPIIDIIAPEHLQLSIANPRDLIGKFRNAGSIFLGMYSPEALGDYIAGPNHVLPTSGTSRFASGLSVLDFLKRSSIIESNKEAIEALSEDAMIIAESEGLSAHSLSIYSRIDKKK